MPTRVNDIKTRLSIMLNSCHRDNLGYVVSPVDASLGVLRGRPYGGVGFVWKHAIDEYVSIIDCDYDWLCCIKVSNHSNDFYLLKVPYECEDNRDVYNDYMSKIVAFCSTCIFIVGDFNADISKTSVFGSILHDFCNDFSFSIADCWRSVRHDGGWTRIIFDHVYSYIQQHPRWPDTSGVDLYH